MKETGSSEIVEHDLAEGYVHAGQPLDLYRRQRHTRHLDVFGPYSFERQPVGQRIHTISLELSGRKESSYSTVVSTACPTMSSR